MRWNRSGRILVYEEGEGEGEDPLPDVFQSWIAFPILSSICCP